MLRTLYRSAFIGLGLAFLGGCTVLADATVKSGVGVACGADTDCQGDGATCDATKTCTLPCSDADTCPSGSTCVASHCRSAGAAALGSACKTGADCASSTCDQGVCTSICTATPDCPGGSVCVDKTCQLTLESTFVYDNVVSNAKQGFALAHELGRQEAVKNLPWLEAGVSEGNTNDTVSGAIEGVVGKGSKVVFVTSNRFATEALEKANLHKDVQFFTYSTIKTAANLSSYNVRFHQAWFIAGYVASRFQTDGKIGFLGAIPFPEVVRQLNAFALGALAANKNARVEVVWANDFVPSDIVTRKLVDYLITGGNGVIVNRLGLGNAVTYVQELHSQKKNVYSIGINNPNACDSGMDSCLGAPYFNWGPLYTRVLDSVHNHTFDPTMPINDSIQVDPAESTFHFALNSAISGLDGLKPDIVLRIGDLVGPKGEDKTFSGGFCATDAAQRAPKPKCVDAGVTDPAVAVDDNELANMCWLVKGVVQPTDPEDPASALIDARAPDGSVYWPPKSVDPTSLTKPSCK
jgi:simple sugar transport system substrate-binding protein